MKIECKQKLPGHEHAVRAALASSSQTLPANITGSDGVVQRGSSHAVGGDRGAR